MQAVMSQSLALRAPIFLGWVAVTALLLVAVFFDSLAWMSQKWFESEEYSHGVMIPFVAAYLAYQRRHRLVHDSRNANVLALPLLAFGLAAFVVADLATIYVGVLLAFLLCVYALVLLSLGWRNTKELIAPLAILAFMVPLPNFLTNNLSAELQLISSQLGVAFIRLFDITVYLEGNVIDLGSYKLQVVDACSGLRYLFPLVALGFILAYLCQIPLWLRACIFISTIPITVVMNSIRIGAIGVSVEYWGPQMAEGILHDVEGWFMFMASLGVLMFELFLLLRLSGDKRKLLDIMVIDGPDGDTPEQAELQSGPKLLLGLALAALAVMFVYSISFAKAEEVVPERLPFNHFPLLVGDWYGTPGTIEQVYIDELKFDDYIIADYRKGAERLNFYVAYYGSQKKGQSAHSPRSCIPGDGWQIQSIETIHLNDLYLNSQPLMVNRTLIQKGDYKQVVYYWFQQRSRIVTNEYKVKWYIFLDALTKNRTDGALVRLTVPLGRDADVSEADAMVGDFMTDLQFRMNDFIPQ